jgi:hypothetical protein
LVRIRGNRAFGGIIPVGRLVIIRELVRRLMKYLVYQILNSITLNICYGCLIIFENNRVGESVRLGVMSDSVYNHVIRNKNILTETTLNPVI